MGHKVTFYHVGGHLWIDEVATDEARRISAALKNPETACLQIDSRGRGSESTTFINVRLVTNVNISPALPEVGTAL